MGSERPSLETLIQKRRTLNGMYAGTFWRHNGSGDIYKITSTGIRECDYEPVVHYTPIQYPDMEWDRDLTEWLENVGSDDMPRPRFSRVHPTTVYG